MDGLVIGLPIPVSIPTPTSALIAAGPQEPGPLGLSRRGFEDEEDDLEGQPAKRQKLEVSAPAAASGPPSQPQPLMELALKPEHHQDQDQENQDNEPPNEDDAVLALAAHGLPDSVGTFGGAE